MSATTIGQVHKTTSSTKPLWIAVGALGAAVLALGATLAYQQAQPAGPRLTPISAMASMQTEAGNTSITAPAAIKQDEAEKPVTAPVVKAPVPSRSVASKNERATGSTSSARASSQGAASPSPVVVAQPAPRVVRPVCGNCGRVESATPIQREGTGTGLGAVAGGVLGAVVGNQVGGGNGRTAATVLGALGGGWAGNSVEKKMKNETLYQVRVRMEDGGSRTFEMATPVNAGSHVTVEGGSLRMADGSMASPRPRPQRQTQSSPNPMYTGG